MELKTIVAIGLVVFIVGALIFLKIRGKNVFVKRKCEQKGPKKVSTFSTRFHVVSNVFPKYQMLTF